jgi:hypothetical protein
LDFFIPESPSPLKKASVKGGRGENHKEKSEKQGYDEKEFSFLLKQA